MPSINEVATQRVFSGLTCAYTGKKVTVRVVASGSSRPLFFSPDAFDPSLPVDSLPELLRLASFRNGVEGAVSGEGVLVCPYTGNRMSILKDASGFSLTGGFRPSCPTQDAAKFVFDMRMRSGIAGCDFPEPTARVQFVEDKAPSTTVAPQTPKDYSLEYAEDALKQVLPSRPSVMVSGDAPRKRRKA